MAESFCGKSCSECLEKSQGSCPGCNAGFGEGPGNRADGKCEIAKCVKIKGHETCESCNINGHCGNYQGRHRMPEERRKKAEAERLAQIDLEKKATLLGSLLRVLFWLILPNTLASVLKQFGSEPGINFAGELLGSICAIAYGLILIKMSSCESEYKSAGICLLIGSVINFIASIISGGEEVTWILLLTLPAAVILMIGEYKEYMGHCAALVRVDSDLSEKWSKLWVWYIALFAGVMLSPVVILIIPILGALIALVGAIGLIVVSIIKLVYLYKSGTAFRDYAD